MVSVEYSGLVISLFLALRWVLYWCLRYLGLGPLDSSTADEGSLQSLPSSPPSSSSPPSNPSAQTVRDSLHVARYGEIESRLPDSSATCAVCLNDLCRHDRVWELRNCCHVFHMRCLDRWLDHDEHKTCPLCRAPLMGQDLGLERSEPSWPVEHLLYLFGDDLLVAQ